MVYSHEGGVHVNDEVADMLAEAVSSSYLLRFGPFLSFVSIIRVILKLDSERQEKLERWVGQFDLTRWVGGFDLTWAVVPHHNPVQQRCDPLYQ